MTLSTDERTAGLTAWTRAAQRALAADLPHQLRRRGGAVLVPSCTQDGQRYHVQVEGGRVGQCDCPAGLAGKPCKHVAAVALRLHERETGARVVALKAIDPQMVARYVRPQGA